MIKVIIFMFVFLVGINKSYADYYNFVYNFCENEDLETKIIIKYFNELGVNWNKYIKIMQKHNINKINSYDYIEDLITQNKGKILQELNYWFLATQFKKQFNIELEDIATDINKLNEVIINGLGEDILNKYYSLLYYANLFTYCRISAQKYINNERYFNKISFLARETADYNIKDRDTKIRIIFIGNDIYFIHSYKLKQEYKKRASKRDWNFDIPLI
jgi:hypothetical protein